MNVRKKVVLIVTVSTLLTAVPGTVLIYGYAKQNTLASESAMLEKVADGVSASVMHRFARSEPKLKNLAAILEEDLAKPIRPGEISAFYDIVERNPDGVWRNRKPDYDGEKEAGIFLPPNDQEDDTQKIHHLRIKRVMDVFGAAASESLENVWYLSPYRSEIISDRAFPQFVFDQKADNDYTQTPWVTYTSPALNPNREFRFTPPLFDPVPKVWMVSAIYPLYRHGKWMGSLGEDMQLSNVLEVMFENQHIYKGGLTFLLDRDGKYILAGPWQKQLESTPEDFRPDLGTEPDLAALLKIRLSDKPKTLSDKVMLQGREYVAVAMQLEPLGWQYYRLTPVDEILATTRQLFSALAGMILLAIALTGVLIGTAVGRTITRRINILSKAMRTYTGDHGHRISSQIVGNDEIADAANVFDEMADDIQRVNADRQQALDDLAESRNLLQTIIDSVPMRIFWKDRESRYLGCNPSFARDAGLAEPEKLIGKDDTQLSWKAQAELYRADDFQVMSSGVPKISYDEPQSTPSGGLIWLRTSKVPLLNSARDTVGVVGIYEDITPYKNAEQQLRIAATAFESQEGMMVTDADGHILRVNKAFSEVTGYPAEEVIGKNPRILSSGHHDAAFYEAMWESIKNDGSWGGEIWNRRKNGEVYPEHLTITSVKDVNGIVTNYVSTLTDITLSKAAAERIEHLAFYDPLTQLPNRRLLVDRLGQALASSARSGKTGALLFIDLDNFKNLNDTLGHDIGDLLLQQVATRLVTCVREYDSVARLGGDEFVVMLEELSEQNLEAAAQAEVIADKILAALSQPYQFGGREHHSGGSIGVTLFSGHEQSQETLLKHADIAMYQAKKAGRNTLRFFDPDMQKVITERTELEHALHDALESRQFVAYYQMQVDSSNHPCGAELLIRWLHPERGLISPAHFITLAEETGLIVPIGLWVLDAACALIKSWQQDTFYNGMTISVNVSAKQFRQPDFVEKVRSSVFHHAIDPTLLKLELTESMLLENIEDTVTTMRALKDIGIQFSLDDFGTGYSSLQYLKQLPLDQLKIDRTFVNDIVSDESSRAIVCTIISMAKSMGLSVIAEGVETENQCATLPRSNSRNAGSMGISSHHCEYFLHRRGVCFFDWPDSSTVHLETEWAKGLTAVPVALNPDN